MTYKPGTRVVVVNFDSKAYLKDVTLNGREGVIIPPVNKDFINIVLDQPYASTGPNPVMYGTAEHPVLMLKNEVKPV